MFKVFIHRKMSDRDEGSSNDKQKLWSVMAKYVSRRIIYQAVLL